MITCKQQCSLKLYYSPSHFLPWPEKWRNNEKIHISPQNIWLWSPFSLPLCSWGHLTPGASWVPVAHPHLSLALTWADHRGRVAMGTVRTTQGSHRTTPQEGLSPRAVKSGCWDLITSFHQVWSSGGGDGDSTAKLTTDNIGIGQTPVGGTQRYPSSRNVHLHLPLTLRGAVCHEPDFWVCW